MNGKPGFAKISAYGSAQGFNFVALELLGPSLKALLKTNEESFSVRTVLKIAFNLMDNLEMLHNENIIHADIKPDNVTVGVNNHDLYLIDFGLSYTMKNENEQPVKIKYVIGTNDYLSLGAHQGIVSFENDLESLAFMMVYFLKGKLPWSANSLKNLPQSGVLNAIYEQKKKFFNRIPSSLPRQIIRFMTVIQKMTYVDRPNYDLLRSILK